MTGQVAGVLAVAAVTVGVAAVTVVAVRAWLELGRAIDAADARERGLR